MRPLHASIVTAWFFYSLLGPVPLRATETHHPKFLHFPGNVILRVTQEPVTDELKCSIMAGYGRYVLPQFVERGTVLGLHMTAANQVHFQVETAVAPEPPPQLRIAKAEPFALQLGKKPGKLEVPTEHTETLIQAMYTGQRLVLRWYDSPALNEGTAEIMAGDVPSAYEQAKAKCGWQPLSIDRPKFYEPVLVGDETGFREARIGPDFEQWMIRRDDEGYCEIIPPVPSLLFHIFPQGDGTHDMAGPQARISAVELYDERGMQIGTVETRDVLASVMKSIHEAGRYGYASAWGKRFSLYPVDAVVGLARTKCKEALTRRSQNR